MTPPLSPLKVVKKRHKVGVGASPSDVLAGTPSWLPHLEPWVYPRLYVWIALQSWLWKLLDSVRKGRLGGAANKQMSIRK